LVFCWSGLLSTEIVASFVGALVSVDLPKVLFGFEFESDRFSVSLLEVAFRFLNQSTPPMSKAMRRTPTIGTTTTRVNVLVSMSSDSPPSREMLFSDGAKVGGQVETSITTVFELSTTGVPNRTVVEEVMVVDPKAIDWSTHWVAVAGSEKEVATYRMSRTLECE
jgi:hypothetical protein